MLLETSASDLRNIPDTHNSPGAQSSVFSTPADDSELQKEEEHCLHPYTHRTTTHDEHKMWSLISKRKEINPPRTKGIYMHVKF